MSATLVGAGMVLADVADTIQDLPVEAQVVSALAAVAVAVKSYRVDKAAEARARERQSAFAYVYRGEKEGLLSRCCRRARSRISSRQTHLTSRA